MKPPSKRPGSGAALRPLEVLKLNQKIFNFFSGVEIRLKTHFVNTSKSEGFMDELHLFPALFLHFLHFFSGSGEDKPALALSRADSSNNDHPINSLTSDNLPGYAIIFSAEAGPL